MSHAIEKLQDGSNAWWFDGQPAWHKIPNNADASGIDPNNPADIRRIQRACRADWTVEKAPIFVRNEDGFYPVDNRFLLQRSTDAKILGRGQTVGKSWEPVQNDEAFDFFAEFIAAGDMKMETAGVLDGGDRVWVLARVNEGFETVKGDSVKAHLLLTTHHQFGQATDVRFVAERVVCANTHAVAMREGTQHQVSINHRRKFDPSTVKATLGIGAEIFAEYKEASQFLASKRYTEDTLQEYAEAVYPILGENLREKDRSRNAEKVLEVITEQPGAEFAPGTFWSAYNAVTFLTDNVLGRTAESRLSSAWYGQGMRTKQKALKLALEMAEAA